MYIIIFLISFLMDILWVVYIRKVSQGKALQAALFGSALYFGAAIITIEYIASNILLIPAIAGAFLGTYLSVIISVKYERKNSKDSS